MTKGVIATDFTTISGMEATDQEYKALGLVRSRHIAIRFHRKRTFSQRLGRVAMAPLPTGMSGGGVYAWQSEALKHRPVRLPLAGIANEFVADRSILIATRLLVYIRCIFHNQPDLAAVAGGAK